jgi:uncharacterized DUF497 family protein
MEFEWDEGKDATNRAKHGIGLAEAARMDWSRITEVPDLRRDYGETRIRAYGHIESRLYFCAYAWRDGRRRIISVRKANSREERSYAP